MITVVSFGVVIPETVFAFPSA
jgi:hypothetical protein